MTAEAIISIALALKAVPIEARIVEAVAMQESSRRADVKGDKGEAWGLFQFHVTRWKEHSVATWGKATPAQQVQAMLAEIRDCKRRMKKARILVSEERLIIYVGRHHNIGHCADSDAGNHNKYTRSLWKYYKANKADSDRAVWKKHKTLQCTGDGRYGVMVDNAAYMVGELLETGMEGEDALALVLANLWDGMLPPPDEQRSKMYQFVTQLAYVALQDFIYEIKGGGLDVVGEDVIHVN